MACQDHTALLTRQLDEPLSPGETVGLAIHIRICAGCRRFRRQMRALRDLAGSIGAGLEQGPGMPQAARERLGRRLEDESAKL